MINITLKEIINILIVIGLILIFYNFGLNSKTCPKQKPLYKYIPRDFDSDQNYPDLVKIKFEDMFEKPQPYIVSLDSNNLRKT